MKTFISLACLLGLVFSLGACRCSGGKNRTDSQWTTDMAQQNSVKAQEGSPEGDLLMRIPPEGTRARNRSYYPFEGRPVLAGERLKNPIPAADEVLSQGKLHYQRYCVYCHGQRGDALDGALVAPKMAIPPASLLTDKAKGHSDGRLYHIIHEGQGLMGSYSWQLSGPEQALMSRRLTEESAEDSYKGFESIWAVVHYVRALQKASDTE